MKLLILAALVGVSMAASVAMNQLGDAYNFHYSADDLGGHRRSESGHGGIVTGSYSYVDPNGDLRTVNYRAGPDGFKAEGDTGVDRRTAALAPKAVPAAAPVAPVAPVSPYIHHYGTGYSYHAPGHYAVFY